MGCFGFAGFGSKDIALPRGGLSYCLAQQAAISFIRADRGYRKLPFEGDAVDKVRLLLLSAPLDETEADGIRRRIRKGTPRLDVVGTFPAGAFAYHRYLTPRQVEVLRELALGMRVVAIAKKFGLSVKTVETHRTALMKRLEIKNVPELVRYALQAGILPAAWLLG